jgi:hypothetical protein
MYPLYLEAIWVYNIMAIVNIAWLKKVKFVLGVITFFRASTLSCNQTTGKLSSLFKTKLFINLGMLDGSTIIKSYKFLIS